VLDGNAYAKEDYSQNANQAIFNEVYTKDAYNAIRQSLVDIRKHIILACIMRHHSTWHCISSFN